MINHNSNRKAKKLTFMRTVEMTNRISRILPQGIPDLKNLLTLGPLLFVFLILFSSCEEEMPEPDEWRILEWTVDGERHKASCKSEGLFGCSALNVNYNLTNGSFRIGGGTDIVGSSQFVVIYIFRGLNPLYS